MNFNMFFKLFLVRLGEYFGGIVYTFFIFSFFGGKLLINYLFILG
jgi:hypothetical protein